jgi:Flp pilus assembly protein TadD
MIHRTLVFAAWISLALPPSNLAANPAADDERVRRIEANAVRIFQRNVEEYPKSSNLYDSLGEAYAKVGQKALAIRSYEKALELDPKNQNAADRLKKLRQRE